MLINSVYDYNGTRDLNTNMWYGIFQMTVLMIYYLHIQLLYSGLCPTVGQILSMIAARGLQNIQGHELQLTWIVISIFILNTQLI